MNAKGIATALLLFSLGCGEDDSARVQLAVVDVRLGVSLQGAPIEADREGIVLDIVIQNVSNANTSLAAPLFSVALVDGLEIAGSPLTELIDDACLADASVAEGATVSCSLLFVVPEGSLPLTLNYQLSDSRRVSAPIEVCAPEETLCDRTCVDLLTDLEHCGDCGVEIPVGGQCIEGSPACPNLEDAVCDGVCIDISVSNQNCGACDEQVPFGASCEGGEPVCPDGQEICGDTCLALDDDPQNCGECGNDVRPRGCIGGVAGCLPTENDCDGMCVSFDDPENCGECGRSVLDIDGASCVDGEVNCPSAQPDQCPTECVNFNTDEHCGGCDQACPGPGSCEGGGTCAFVGQANNESCADFCGDASYSCSGGAQLCTSTFDIGCDVVVTNPACDQECLCVLEF